MLAHPHPSSRSMLHVRWQHAASAYSLIRLRKNCSCCPLTIVMHIHCISHCVVLVVLYLHVSYSLPVSH